jgi:hypothetical protein
VSDQAKAKEQRRREQKRRGRWRFAGTILLWAAILIIGWWLEPWTWPLESRFNWFVAGTCGLLILLGGILQGKFEDLEARIASIEADLEELHIPQQARESYLARSRDKSDD